VDEENALTPESKRERFVRIAEKRTRLVLEKLRILANCSNRGVYEYTEDDVAKIFGTLQRQLDATRARFEDRAKKIDFKLEP
jgi:hypothetical protein